MLGSGLILGAFIAVVYFNSIVEIGITNEFSRGDIPQTGEHGDILTAEERMEFIREREWETFVGTLDRIYSRRFVRR